MKCGIADVFSAIDIISRGNGVPQVFHIEESNGGNSSQLTFLLRKRIAKKCDREQSEKFFHFYIK
ncbi:hypothetical protein SDC9_148311 [bioreactor metagenome]|uniref:Uncharacterized protein n=1 Tax=bioreactor metagenome TaxID=1076179 RepID=A0A645EGH7_9ZZZZ